MEIVFGHLHQRFSAHFDGKMTRRRELPEFISRGVTFFQHINQPQNIAIARQQVAVKPSK